MAMTGICGNFSRTIFSNSKPDILGMRKSEMIRSGIELESLLRASTPSSAVTTSYPSDSKSSKVLSRTEGSSSTQRILYRGLDKVGGPEVSSEVVTSLSHGKMDETAPSGK